jgi:uncharacterized protein (TIGR03086 family)
MATAIDDAAQPQQRTDAAAERHRGTAARFREVAEGVTDWDAPSPVDDWVARDVPDHLITWFTAFLASGGIDLPVPANHVDTDPVGAWVEHSASVQELFADPERRFVHPHTGEHSIADAIDMFYTADVFMHTWDLAMAAGIDPELDPDRCAEMLAGMQPIEELLRTSGQYGPPVKVAQDATAEDRLMAFIGRNPRWTPPTL